MRRRRNFGLVHAAVYAPDAVSDARADCYAGRAIGFSVDDCLYIERSNRSGYCRRITRERYAYARRERMCRHRRRFARFRAR